MECMRFPASAVSFDSGGHHGVDYRLEAYLAHVMYKRILPSSSSKIWALGFHMTLLIKGSCKKLKNVHLSGNIHLPYGVTQRVGGGEC